MTSMDKLVVEFEYKLWHLVGDLMPRTALDNPRVSYTAHYTTQDKSGSILIIVTHDDTLNLSFHKGIRPSLYSEIYTTPTINNLNSAQQVLDLLENIIAISAYEGYDVSIEEYAARFKKNFVY